MPAHQCDLCQKVFKLKTDLERHKEKKTPCVSADKIIEKHKSEIIESKNSIDNINEVKRFLDFCHNTLRDKEGIIGMKALNNIAILLFLKFVNNNVKNNTIDLLHIEKYRKENGTSELEGFKNNKHYIKYCQFDNIIENGKFKCDETEIMTIIEFIFRHILWIHPKTKNVFQDEMPTIKNDLTYVNILKKMDKVPWEDMDIDIKGLAYEHFLKYEMGSGSDLGQFFTKREVVSYMINLIKPYIKLNSRFIDPFMGTGGFVTHMFNEIRNMYKKDNIPFTDEIKNNLTNGIEKNPQTCLLALNNMLMNMDLFPENVNCGDSLRNFIDEKYDIVLTNPPFGIKGLEYGDDKKDNSSFPKEFNSIKKEEYFPYKSNDAICLALQMIPYILNKNGIAAIIVPDGKQITGEKEKSLVEIRKNLIENNNLFQVTKLPSGTFLPYTGVETLILFFKKGEKTKEVKFVKLDDKYKNETLICNIKANKIKDKKYSLNYKLYIQNNINLHTNLKYKKILDLFTYIKGTIQSSKIDNIENGKYTFVTGAEDIKFKKINLLNNYELLRGENIFISHRGNGDSRPVKYYNGECYFSDLMTLLKPIYDINVKFIYYYLKFNQSYIEENFQKGACNKTLDFTLFNEMQIPVPPVEVQNLIVKELDLMYREKERLHSSHKDTELLKQIHFDSLLMKCKDTETVKLGDIIKVSQGEYLKKENMETGEYPIYGGGEISGYINKCNRESKYIISKDGVSQKCVRYAEGKFFLNHHAWTYDIINKKANNIFIGKYLIAIQDKIYSLATGTAQMGINQENFYKINILLPSLKDQEDIIKQMEQHDIRVKCQEQEIELIDKLIKERFEYHLQKCKDTKDTKDKPKEEPEKNLDDDEPIKESKKEKDISDNDDKEDDNIEEKPKKDNSKKIKVKSKKLKKEELTDNDIKDDIKQDKPKKTNSKKITIKTKKTKKNVDINEETEENPKKTSK